MLRLGLVIECRFGFLGFYIDQEGGKGKRKNSLIHANPDPSTKLRAGKRDFTRSRKDREENNKCFAIYAGAKLAPTKIAKRFFGGIEDNDEALNSLEGEPW